MALMVTLSSAAVENLAMISLREGGLPLASGAYMYFKKAAIHAATNMELCEDHLMASGAWAGLKILSSLGEYDWTAHNILARVRAGERCRRELMRWSGGRGTWGVPSDVMKGCAIMRMVNAADA